MKKCFLLILVTVFSCFATYADQLQKVETLSAKVVLQNAEGYFVLSDGSLWKAIGFVKRWRSLSEWWNDAQLAPKCFECVPNDWYLGAQIAIDSKYGNLGVNEANASNQEILKRCTHVMTNLQTGQVLFAIALHPAEGLVELFNDAHTDGYSKGYTKGRCDSFANASESYNSGHSEGYKAGYREGYQAALHDQQPAM